MSILVVGSVALDTIKTPTGKQKDVLGGSAVHFSVAARAFTEVNLVAVVGDDFPKQHLSFLEKQGIGLGGLDIRSGEKTFRWEGEYGPDCNVAITLATHLNVFATFDPCVPKSLRKSKYVFLANIDPEIQAKVLHQLKKPKLVACDTMNFWIEGKRKALVKLLKHIDVFLLNEGEAKLLSGENNLLKAAKSIVKMGPKQVIIKKGEHGVLLFTPQKIFSVPAFIVEEVIDPTGAGDTFAGGFLGYLAAQGKVNDKLIRKAIVHGAIVASYTVEGFGSKHLSKLSKTAIQKRLKQFKKIIEF